MGATLDIQRQEHMERIEQQILLQRSRDARQMRQVGSSPRTFHSASDGLNLNHESKQRREKL